MLPPCPYDLRQISFSPTVLQHAGSVYGDHLSRSPTPQQPLDYSPQYSPTSMTYHCITCEKVTSHFLSSLTVLNCLATS